MPKMKIVLLLIGLTVSLLFGSETKLPVRAEEAQEEDLGLYSKGAVLMDAKTGRVLYEKNGYEHMPNASTTKIMTCILAIESQKLDDTVSVSSYAASMPKVRLGMDTSDSFLLKDLLYSLMLESHNDSAAAIAEYIGGTVEGFADMMNQKAKQLGCKDTYFITPNGLDAQNEIGVHGTTAADLALIMSYCIQNETFLEITRTPSYSFTNQAGTKNYNCNNHNAFLQMMEGALSGKTGFTGNAGYCYVGALTRDDKTFIVALLACGWPNHKTYKWEDTKKLMNYGLEHYQYQDIFEYEKELPVVRIKHAVPKDGSLYQEVTASLGVKEEPLILLKNGQEQVRTVYELPETLEAPVKAGQKVGKVTYYIGETKIGAFPIFVNESAEKLDFSWYGGYIMKIFFMKTQFCFQ